MFIRLKKNASGTSSVQVIHKEGRNNKVLKIFGTSAVDKVLERLKREARLWIDEQKGESLFEYEEVELIKNASDYDAIFKQLGQKDLILAGPELVYGRLFDKIGYNTIKTTNSELFKSLVVTRLYKPGSKLRSQNYLWYFTNKYYDIDRIYRYLDELCYRKPKDIDKEQEEKIDKQSVKYQVEQISYDQTKSVVGGDISVVFYDTTTMYFESREDDMRIPGWSKDGKNSNPQIVFGLLVAAGGNPIGYEVHKGNQYEGSTLIPIIKKLQKRFGFKKPVVIADAGLLNKANIKSLEADGYEYILGARIKSLPEEKKAEVLALGLQNGQSGRIELDNKSRMVVTMSEARAKKEVLDREKGIERLKKKYATGKLSKSQINNRGYNRYLTLEGDMSVAIDYSKIEYDTRFDGLKGYTTNCSLSDKDIVDNYKYLFMIERAFRFNKTDLDIRPMYHSLFNRIEAHICICFTAYTIMLELERVLKAAKSEITLQRAKFLSEKIYQLSYTNPFDKKRKSVIIKTEEDQEVSELLSIIENHCNKQ